MGNIVAFQRRSEVVSFDSSRDRRLISCESKDLPTNSETGLAHGVQAERSMSQASPAAFERVGLTQFARRNTWTGERPDHDAYLLVLLADQELIAGRDAEARSLLDAAYAVYDR